MKRGSGLKEALSVVAYKIKKCLQQNTQVTTVPGEAAGVKREGLRSETHLCPEQGV